MCGSSSFSMVQCDLYTGFCGEVAQISNLYRAATLTSICTVDNKILAMVWNFHEISNFQQGSFTQAGNEIISNGLAIWNSTHWVPGPNINISNAVCSNTSSEFVIASICSNDTTSVCVHLINYETLQVQELAVIPASDTLIESVLVTDSVIYLTTFSSLYIYDIATQNVNATIDGKQCVFFQVESWKGTYYDIAVYGDFLYLAGTGLIQVDLNNLTQTTTIPSIGNDVYNIAFGKVKGSTAVMYIVGSFYGNYNGVAGIDADGNPVDDLHQYFAGMNCYSATYDTGNYGY